MLTCVIVKARIDSSLNLYEHCVACGDENNCPAGRALRGQPCGANPAGPLPLTMLRLALYTACRGVKTPRKAVYSHIVSPKMASGSAHGAFLQHKCAPKAKQALFGVFWGYFGCTRKKARFGPILTYFEAIFGLHLASRGSTGQLWAQKCPPPFELTTYPAHFWWVSSSKKGLFST